MEAKTKNRSGEERKERKSMTVAVRTITRVGLVAAAYIAITFALAPISFGMVQVRLSESLTVLPIVMPEAIPALYIGCLLANILGGMGLWDIFLGSFITLLAALATYALRRSKLAYLPPILFNAFGVSAYLAPLTGIPYWYWVAGVGFGQSIAVALGALLLSRFKKFIKY